MRYILLLSISLSFLFACSSGSNNKKTNSTQNNVSVVTDVSDSLKTTKVVIHNADSNKSISKKSTEPKAGFIAKPGILPMTEVERTKSKNAGLEIKRAKTAFNNGTVYYDDGELHKAAQAFKTSLEYKPNNSKAFYNLGKIYYDLGQKQLSMAYYKDAVDLNKSDSLSLVAIGLLYYEMGNITDAVAYYNEAEKIAPHFSMLYFNRGTLYGQQKQYQLSISDLTNAIKYNDKDSESYVNRGLAYFYVKNINLACADWQKAALMDNAKGRKAFSTYCKRKE